MRGMKSGTGKSGFSRVQRDVMEKAVISVNVPGIIGIGKQQEEVGM